MTVSSPSVDVVVRMQPQAASQLVHRSRAEDGMHHVGPCNQTLATIEVLMPPPPHVPVHLRQQFSSVAVTTVFSL